MLFVILVLCATVSAVPWHYSEASGAGVTGTTGPSTSVIYHRRYPMYGRTYGYDTYEERGRHPRSPQEDRRHPHFETNSDIAKKYICFNMLEFYQTAWPDARLEGKALSVTVQFKHGNRTVNCMKYR